MIENRSVPQASVIPVLSYPDVADAAAWLCRVFGFRVRLRIGDHRVQLVHGDGAVVVTELADTGAESIGATHSVLVRVVDIGSHHERAVDGNARILSPPTDYPYEIGRAHV